MLIDAVYDSRPLMEPWSSDWDSTWIGIGWVQAVCCAVPLPRVNHTNKHISGAYFGPREYGAKQSSCRSDGLCATPVCMLLALPPQGKEQRHE